MGFVAPKKSCDGWLRGASLLMSEMGRGGEPLGVSTERLYVSGRAVGPCDWCESDRRTVGEFVPGLERFAVPVASGESFSLSRGRS